METMQIRLTERNSERASELARDTGKTPDELVNDAFDRFISESTSRTGRTSDNARERAFGMFKGQIWMSDDFDAPLSEEELKEWEKWNF